MYVLDHHGIEHYVEMQPGDMVLYEGASCSHGREQPLEGDWFANVNPRILILTSWCCLGCERRVSCGFMTPTQTASSSYSAVPFWIFERLASTPGS